MTKHVTLLSMLAISILLTAGCDDFLDLEPDQPPPPDAGPSGPPADAGPGYPPLPAPEGFPDQPVVTTPGTAIPPPTELVDIGVHVVFPPAESITTARHVTVRGTARLDGGVAAVRVNGVNARLSEPDAAGAVTWQADVQVTSGRSELVVSGVNGDGILAPEVAGAALTFSPDMLVRPGHMALDVGHDRLLVSDRMQGIVAIDLATGTPASVRLAETADGPVYPFYLSLDAATGRLLGMFQQSSCDDDLRDEVEGVISIDLRDGSTTIADEFERYSGCEAPGGPSTDLESAVVLLPGSDSFFYLVSGCGMFGGECHAEVRRRRLGDSGPRPADVPLCASRQCWAADLLADPAGAALLALVREGDSPRPADTSYEVRAIDPVAGTQTPLVTVQTEWDGAEIRPWSMVLDAAGNRVLVLGNTILDDLLSSKLSVIGVDLATGAQSLLALDAAVNAWGFGDALYDHRRDRLILSDGDRGLVTLDLATGGTGLLFRPSIGAGSLPSCSYDHVCEVSNLDSSRQRFFVHSHDYAGGDIYVVDLTSGERRLLSPRGSTIEFGETPRLFTDTLSGHLYALHENRGLYMVDGSTGERSYLWTVPKFEHASAAWDSARGRIVYITEQDGGHALHTYEVQRDEEQVISSDTVGSGPLLRPVDVPSGDAALTVTLDASGTRAFVSQISGRLLFEVDLATGNRRLHTLDEPAVRPASRPWLPQPVLADTLRNRILIGEFPSEAIGAFDLATGTTSLFVDYYRADPPLWAAVELIPEHTSERALLVDDRRDVHMLDLRTGQRVLVMKSDREPPIEQD